MKQLKYCILALLLVSCSGPQAYVVKAVKIMDKNGLFAEGEAWESARHTALHSNPETMEDAHAVIIEALKVAGGKHSFLYPADRVSEDAESEWEMPSVSINDSNVATVRLPKFSGNQNEGIRYAQTVIDAVPDDIRGVVIDLRGNTGGNMFPMISSVHKFIADGSKMLRFRSRKNTSWIPLTYVVKIAGIEQKPLIDCPVAILTDSLTASSAEATLICFRGLSNVRTFGGPTAGYASCNSTFPMMDGASVVLTTACDVARTGEVFCDDPILPDVASDSPEEDAMRWITCP